MINTLELQLKVTDLNYIKIINGRWAINGKTFEEQTLNERLLVCEKILSL